MVAIKYQQEEMSMTEKNKFIKKKQDQLEAACREHGLPFTMQRREIMGSLAGRQDHPTADDLYEEVQERIKGVSRTTVYRVLDTLVSHDLAQKISNPEAKARFDANTDRHHHVHCLRCGAVADIHDPQLNDLALPSREVSGYEIIDYAISFKGICATCRGGEA
jgi:Fur family transcriptional regulator, peroxide stress response regulator